MTYWKCWGGVDCNHPERSLKQGMTQYCYCEVDKQIADKQIAKDVREIASNHAPTERIWIRELVKIVEQADSQ